MRTIAVACEDGFCGLVGATVGVSVGYGVGRADSGITTNGAGFEIEWQLDFSVGGYEAISVGGEEEIVKKCLGDWVEKSLFAIDQNSVLL